MATFRRVSATGSRTLAASRTAPTPTRSVAPISTKVVPAAGPRVVGQRVWHEQLGKGRVTAITGATASIRFEAEPAIRVIQLSALVSWKARTKAAIAKPAAKPRVGSSPSSKGPVPATGPAARQLPAPDPAAWYPVTRTLIILAKERGLRVEPRPGGYVIRASRSPHVELVRIREDEVGAHSAKAAVSAGAGAPDVYRQVVMAVNREIARHLQRGLDLSARLLLMDYLRKMEVRLDQSSHQVRAPRPAKAGQAKSPAPAASTEGVGRWERKTWPGMVRFVQGGSPGLGRRS